MILLLDNYDSFVHNLARYVRLAGVETVVRRSDEVDVQLCEQLNPSAVIISPGPKRPEQAGASIDIIRRLSPAIPILGVCLGHQAIAVAFGGIVSRSEPAHGVSASISHSGQGLFSGCPSPMNIGRYHSLAVEERSLPDELVVTARTADGIVMAMEHRERPVFGVQFHPESILTDHGQTLINNFVRLPKLALRSSTPLLKA